MPLEFFETALSHGVHRHQSHSPTIFRFQADASSCLNSLTPRSWRKRVQIGSYSTFDTRFSVIMTSSHSGVSSLCS
jgi:hypothetical protein